MLHVNVFLHVCEGSDALVPSQTIGVPAVRMERL